MTEQPAPSSPVVLRYEGMFPADIAGYEKHRTRKGGDLGHVNRNSSRPNRRLIGPEDWAEKTLAMIEDMKTENFADELETLTRRRRTAQVKKRMVEGPREPWRATRHGPLREVILTANKDWFDAFEDDDDGTIDFHKRERLFEERAVAWLQSQFGDDVVHARADLDESSYHIHAVIVPKVLVDLNGTKRWMLQPSKHEMIKDYEAAQDSVGEWFAPIGLVRGERRAAAVRAARQAGEEPPEYRTHNRTSAWRREKELELENVQERLKAEEQLAADARVNLEARAAEVTAREVKARRRKHALKKEEERLKADQKHAQSKTDEAEAVLAVAEGLGDGLFGLAGDENEPELIIDPVVVSKAADGLLQRISRSVRGKSRAVRAFSAAFSRLRSDAEMSVKRDTKEIAEADNIIVEIAKSLSPEVRERIAELRRSLTARIIGLGKSDRDRGGERGQPETRTSNPTREKS